MTGCEIPVLESAAVVLDFLLGGFRAENPPKWSLEWWEFIRGMNECEWDGMNICKKKLHHRSRQIDIHQSIIRSSPLLFNSIVHIEHMQVNMHAWMYTVTPLQRITRERPKIRYKRLSLYPGWFSNETELFPVPNFTITGNSTYPGSL